MSGEASLAGQVALVTGASSGLGRATAMRLAHAGADVALLARGARDLERTASAISRGGTRSLPITADLAQADEVIQAAERVLAELGRVDILVNCAATDVPREIESLTQQEWDRVLAVNLRAPFLLSKAVFPRCVVWGEGRS